MRRSCGWPRLHPTAQRPPRNPALVHLQAALRLYADEKYEQALGRFSAAATPTSPLRAHAAYYAGVSRIAAAPVRRRDDGDFRN